MDIYNAALSVLFSYKDGIIDIAPVSVIKMKHKMRRKTRALQRWKKELGKTPKISTNFYRVTLMEEGIIPRSLKYLFKKIHQSESQNNSCRNSNNSNDTNNLNNLNK